MWRTFRVKRWAIGPLLLIAALDVAYIYLVIDTDDACVRRYVKTMFDPPPPRSDMTPPGRRPAHG